mmetsp:Transcript_23639/g.70333  ORF Transcript_23639/g.70333 Transcript_23639/m.70333 type:complete len:378 (+) Transcript_23639:551-1684(+)
MITSRGRNLGSSACQSQKSFASTSMERRSGSSGTPSLSKTSLMFSAVSRTLWSPIASFCAIWSSMTPVHPWCWRKKRVLHWSPVPTPISTKVRRHGPPSFWISDRIWPSLPCSAYFPSLLALMAASSLSSAASSFGRFLLLFGTLDRSTEDALPSSRRALAVSTPSCSAACSSRASTTASAPAREPAPRPPCRTRAAWGSECSMAEKWSSIRSSNSSRRQRSPRALESAKQSVSPGVLLPRGGKPRRQRKPRVPSGFTRKPSACRRVTPVFSTEPGQRKEHSGMRPAALSAEDRKPSCATAAFVSLNHSLPMPTATSSVASVSSAKAELGQRRNSASRSHPACAGWPKSDSRASGLGLATAAAAAGDRRSGISPPSW